MNTTTAAPTPTDPTTNDDPELDIADWIDEQIANGGRQTSSSSGSPGGNSRSIALR